MYTDILKQAIATDYRFTVINNVLIHNSGVVCTIYVDRIVFDYADGINEPEHWEELYTLTYDIVADINAFRSFASIFND